MKNYLLQKINYLELPMKKIIYDFEIKETNTPTKWIKIVIHHTKNRKTIQSIIDLHVKKNRWSEIGYHFMIGNKGQIYYTRELDTAGAHTYGYNRNSIGIALFGNFDETQATEKQLNSLNKLIEAIKKKYPIRKILGHNQAIYKQIKNTFWKLNLSEINILEIENKDTYKEFIKETNEKVLAQDASSKTVSLIKRFTSCPGFNMYKWLKNNKL
ncbi:MAG: N-acetylmuramoyl-L-alanine amidase [Nanoarchaeota archaeon]|nr:N-acetylmuramoyl-L-alanine amidase [Nanoarchaeota archaeon]